VFFHIGNGSSSCTPKYKTDIGEITIQKSNPAIYTYPLSYALIAEEDADRICTMDYVPHGPRWIIKSISEGTHVFEINGVSEAKLWVAPRKSPPQFSHATISGAVRIADVKNTDENLRVPPTHPQCTVALVLYSADVYRISKYSVITYGPLHEFSIENIPVELLLDPNVFLVAVQNGKVGYAHIPGELEESMKIIIALYPQDILPDDASNGSRAATEFAAQLPSSIRTAGPRFRSSSELRVTAHGIEVMNPQRQRIAVRIFSLDGRMVWSNGSGSQREAGLHLVQLPKSLNGTYLVEVKGEQFTSRKRISIVR